MKIIDLLNKIANGEKVPKFKYDGLIWKYSDDNFYWSDNTYLDSYCDITQCLNDEVEIIEDKKPTFNDIREKHGLPRIKDKKIEPLTTWYGVEPVSFEHPNTFKENAKYIDYNAEMFFNKINEIIDYLEEIK